MIKLDWTFAWCEGKKMKGSRSGEEQWHTKKNFAQMLHTYEFLLFFDYSDYSSGKCRWGLNCLDFWLILLLLYIYSSCMWSYRICVYIVCYYHLPDLRIQPFQATASCKLETFEIEKMTKKYDEKSKSRKSEVEKKLKKTKLKQRMLRIFVLLSFNFIRSM